MSVQALQGLWRVESLEVDGAAMPASVFATARISVEGDMFNSSGMGAEYKGRMSIDADASPARFSILFTTGPEAGRVNHGIYEIDADRWRFCLCMTGGQAPDAFATSPGQGRALQTLVREPQ